MRCNRELQKWRGVLRWGKSLRLIRFYKVFPRKFHQCLLIVHDVDEGVVFFGRRTGHWDEPVTIVRCAEVNCPVFHGARNHFCNGGIERRAFHDRFL